MINFSNKIMMILLLIIFLIIILLFFLYNKKNIQKFNNEVSIHVGNVISHYFYNLSKAIVNNEDFKYTKHDVTFFKNLPVEINKEDYPEWIEVYNNFKNNNITPIFFVNNNYAEAMWECNKDELETYNICIKPIVHRILNDTFIKSNLVNKVNCPVIHFRCADTPFVKHPGYHLQKYKYFKNALDKIKNTIKLNNNKVIILYNNTHLSNEKNMKACDIYVKELKNQINKLGYDVSIGNNSNMDDFSIMFYAPAVISTHSSFSFMSGFFGMGQFLSAGHYLEQEPIIECKKCGDWLYKGYDLYHKDVKDYYDTENIIKQLSL